MVSPDTRIHIVRAFLSNPYPADWLFTGLSGLGKASVADIKAKQLAAHRVNVCNWAGNDVDMHAVREIERQLSQ